jgi:hypothetical protein
MAYGSSRNKNSAPRLEIASKVSPPASEARMDPGIDEVRREEEDGAGGGAREGKGATGDMPAAIAAYRWKTHGRRWPPGRGSDGQPWEG